MPTDFGATVTAPLLEEIGPDHIGLRCQRWGGSSYRHSGSSGARPGFPRLRSAPGPKADLRDFLKAGTRETTNRRLRSFTAPALQQG
jgi:hypothetical protein